MTIGDLIDQWCDSTGYDPSDLCFAYEPEWEKVSEEHLCEQKYSNCNEIVLRHVQSGRFVRFYEHSLPYGITDYGMEPDEPEFEEVFPVERNVTAYVSKEEIES